MRSVILRTQVLVLGIFLTGCAPTTGAVPEVLTKVTAVQAMDSHRALSRFVGVRCRRADGVIVAVLDCGNEQREVELIRDGSFFCVSSAPKVVLVHDEWYSDDDRVVVHDFRQAATKPLILTHDEPQDYVHCHFSIDDAGGQLILQEYEYAGSSKPRSRRITVRLTGSKVEVRKEQWRYHE
jgi:hypothetical protein